MAHVSRPSIHGVTGDDQIRLQVVGDDSDTMQVLWLPGGVGMFFQGEGREAEDNLIGFLDRLHAIRNALLQDRADRAEVA